MPLHLQALVMRESPGDQPPWQNALPVPLLMLQTKLVLMSIHFAPARTASHASGRAPLCRPVARALTRRAMEHVANDNGNPHATHALQSEVVQAALRHFAEHGLGAAKEAAAHAQAAGFTGDRKNYEWWLGITRTLDRRLADQISGMT